MAAGNSSKRVKNRRGDGRRPRSRRCSGGRARLSPALALALLVAGRRLPRAESGPASPHPFRLEQPDGSQTPPLYSKGDIRYNYVVDADGYPVIRDEGGWWVYAEGSPAHSGGRALLDEDAEGPFGPAELAAGHALRDAFRPSGMRVGRINPAKRGLRSHRSLLAACGGEEIAFPPTTLEELHRREMMPWQERQRVQRQQPEDRNLGGLGLSNADDELNGDGENQLFHRLPQGIPGLNTSPHINPNGYGSEDDADQDQIHPVDTNIMDMHGRGWDVEGWDEIAPPGVATDNADDEHDLVSGIPGATHGKHDDVPSLASAMTSRMKPKDRTAPPFMRNLVVPVIWSDHAADPTRSRAPPLPRFEAIFNGPTPDQKYAPTGSIRHVFDQYSYGKFTLKSDCLDKWYRVSQTEAWSSGGVSGFTNRISQPLMEALDKVAEDRIARDIMGGREVHQYDSVTFLHTGFGSEFYGTDCHGAEASDRIWVHARTFNWKENGVGKAHRIVYTIASAYWGRCGTDPARVGMIAHELGHTLGLIDMYGGPSQRGNGLGYLDVMAYAWGTDNSQLYPPQMSCWTKDLLGWAPALEVPHDGRFLIGAMGLDPSKKNGWGEFDDKPKCLKISKGYAGDEYLLIEYRKPVGFDKQHRGNGGVCVYHVDEQANSFNKPGHPDQDDFLGFPENGNHYMIACLPQDKKYDLEKGNNIGDAGDCFQPGTGLGPSKGKWWPLPNTDSYRGGRIMRTDVSFEVEEPTAEEDEAGLMAVRIAGVAPAPPSKAPTPIPTVKPTPRPTRSPTPVPTPSPTKKPKSKPTLTPTVSPTFKPTKKPRTPSPTVSPTLKPTPNPTMKPTLSPTFTPTLEPTDIPTDRPTESPTRKPTEGPTSIPTRKPTDSPTSAPTAKPTSDPTFSPTDNPTFRPTHAPTFGPTSAPTAKPTSDPTFSPTDGPTLRPTLAPTFGPTLDPTLKPTPNPTPQPSAAPTTRPTVSVQPSAFPSSSPSAIPTSKPSATPSASPTVSMEPSTSPTVSAEPSGIPTASPSTRPSASPSSHPTPHPSSSPSGVPSLIPSASPTVSAEPSAEPSGSPTPVPSAEPSATPTSEPSGKPSAAPTLSHAPSSAPSAAPTPSPSAEPSATPTAEPSTEPSAAPTISRAPSLAPSVEPTPAPSGKPSDSPSKAPSLAPSSGPTLSHAPSAAPSAPPSLSPTITDLPSSSPSSAPSPQWANRDADGDGLLNGVEVLVHGTNYTEADTDGDGLTDAEEVNDHRSDPLKIDTDGDGLSDYQEVYEYFTDPTIDDTDGDGLSDYEEVNEYLTDPNNMDTDFDALSDGDEVNLHGTDPLAYDTDGDGVMDGQEIMRDGTDATDPHNLPSVGGASAGGSPVEDSALSAQSEPVPEPVDSSTVSVISVSSVDSENDLLFREDVAPENNDETFADAAEAALLAGSYKEEGDSDYSRSRGKENSEKKKKKKALR